jgi:uncharacterized protein YggE
MTCRLVGLFCLLLATGCSAPGPPGTLAEHSVAVHGSALLRVKPDRVSFTAGVETIDPFAAVAFKTNTARVQSVLAALKERGVTSEQMQTSQLVMETLLPQGKAPRRFRVANLITVVREDPGEVGALIQAAVGAGANDVGSLRFFVADEASFQQQGLQMAFRNARAKAEILAGQAGARVGKVLSMSDQHVTLPEEMQGRLRSLGYVGGRMVEPGVEQMGFGVTAVFALE